MPRFVDWRTRLQSFLAENADRVFQPGVWDCCLFSSDVVKTIRGDDLAAPFRGLYTTMPQGFALLNAAGYADQEEFVEAHFPEKPVLFAAVGDLAIVEQRGQIGVGVVIGPSIAVVTLNRGIGHIPLTRARRVFGVN